MGSTIVKKSTKNETCDFSIFLIKPMENEGFSRLGVSKFHPNTNPKNIAKSMLEKVMQKT